VRGTVGLILARKRFQLFNFYSICNYSSTHYHFLCPSKCLGSLSDYCTRMHLPKRRVCIFHSDQNTTPMLLLFLHSLTCGPTSQLLLNLRSSSTTQPPVSTSPGSTSPARASTLLRDRGREILQLP